MRHTLDMPFTLATLEDDDVAKRLDLLVDELTGRADTDAFGCELADPVLINELADDIRDHLQNAILWYRTSTVVVDDFAERHGVRA